MHRSWYASRIDMFFVSCLPKHQMTTRNALFAASHFWASASWPFLSLVIVVSALSCASPKPAANVNQTGDSPENAIIVQTADAEQRWINERYPNARVLVQEVIQQSGKSYDVITIRTESEDRKTFYFDISRFYRKKS